ncbi:MAG TPA: alpha/beta hydrolase [Steroidobacteraceae bacterium]|nr:alpha/beta hydrolase [Steroidobacteraceae bacterium]
MNDPAVERRDFLRGLTALGASAWPLLVPSLAVHRARASDVHSSSSARVHYDPAAHFALSVTDVPMRRNRAGRMLFARVYRPQGPGPFPTVLDLHGGAWNAKDRHAEEPMDRAIAASGVLVVAIDLTLAPEAPYPASIEDASYGVRWLKFKAASWNGDAARIGIYASSSGGHVAELLAMRPHDARYNAIGFAEAPALDARVAYLAMRSPISDPYARYQNAVHLKRESMMANHTRFFHPWSTIFEANPLQILERHEHAILVPLLIMQGALDDNMLPAIQEKFARTYRAAGGACDYELFAGCEHEWVAKPGPQTERARQMVREFIARQVNL